MVRRECLWAGISNRFNDLGVSHEAKAWQLRDAIQPICTSVSVHDSSARARSKVITGTM